MHCNKGIVPLRTKTFIQTILIRKKRMHLGCGGRALRTKSPKIAILIRKQTQPLPWKVGFLRTRILVKDCFIRNKSHFDLGKV